MKRSWSGFTASFGVFALGFLALRCGSSSDPQVLGSAGSAAGGAGTSGSSAGATAAAGAPMTMGGTAGAVSSAGMSTGGALNSAGAGGGSAGQASGGASVGGSGTVTGGAGGAAGSNNAGSGGSNAGAAGSAGAANGDPNKRQLLLRDEGNSAVHFVDLAHPEKHWTQVVPIGRELQPIGNRRFLIGTDTGYEERSLDDGHLISGVTAFAGTQTAHRLHNGHTLLSGVDFNGGKGIVLVEIDAQAKVQKQIAYAGYTYVRAVRETKNLHYLVAADNKVFEGDATGKVVWEVSPAGPTPLHAWQALPLASGDVVVAAGYAANLQIFPPAKTPVKIITGGTGVKPNFFAGVQVLASGNFIVANWVGHGPGLGGTGLQVLEYSPAGQLVWSWKQDASFVSSLQTAVVLDGMDLNALQVESATSGVFESAAGP